MMSLDEVAARFRAAGHRVHGGMPRLTVNLVVGPPHPPLPGTDIGLANYRTFDIEPAPGERWLLSERAHGVPVGTPRIHDSLESVVAELMLDPADPRR